MKKTIKENRTINQRPNFKLSIISSAILSLPMATSLWAAEPEDTAKTGDIEVIEVRGTRSNLIDAQNMKREGETVLDAISAKDIGSLPDRSVLEAIVRLPGVSIERFAGANDPDHYGVEGSGVVVRGLTHTRSEFNGRDTFTADSGRGLSFQDVPPELMGGVELYKNQSADMIEGGIAGTVNLITRKPFDSDERVLAFTVDATHSDFIDETTPSFSGLYSENFDISNGRIGVLFNYSNSELKAQSDGTQIGRYELQNQLVDGQQVMVPRTTRLTRKQDDRKREGFASTVQWENEDRTILATAQFIRSDSSLAWTENAIEMADDAVINDLIPAAGTSFEVTDQGLFESGLITSTAGWRGNDAERQPGGEFGAQHAMITRQRNQDSLVDDFGFNIRYRPNDTWAFNLDLQYVNSTSEILDFSVMGASRAVVGIAQHGDEHPDISIINPANNGETGYFTNPHNYFWRSAMDHISDNEGNELAFATDAQYTLDEGFFTSLKVGVRHAKREQITRQSTYNWGWLSEAWAGNGSAWFDAEGDELGASLNNQYEQISFDNFARGGVLNSAGEEAFLFPKVSLATDYTNAESAFASLTPGWSALGSRDGAEGHFIPNEINDTVETSNAIYVKANFEGEIGDIDFSGNLGFRYVKIENDTKGFITFPDSVGDPAQPTTDPDHFLPADQAAFGDAGSVEQTASSSYSNVLPSVNVKFNLTDELLLRFGFSEAIALPDLGNLRNYVAITAEDQVITYTGDGDDREITDARYSRYTAKSGNPFLKPMESYSYDLALEWYFAEGVGSLTTSLFYKDLSNYFINGSVDREYTNNGSTQIVQVDGATNGDEGSIKGAEIAYQQFFDFLPGAFSGLGIQFNYTYIDEEGSPNPGLSPDKPNSEEGEGIAFDNLPLEGLSQDNFNLVGMYEKYGVNARIAYNWRSDYLLTTKDVITQLPIYNKAGGQVDASIFYDVSENIKVGLQGSNLTNEVAHTTMQIDNDGNQASRSWFVSDRRFSLVVKGNF
ncbi:TonB-dependent receptor [Psychrosphaera sp. 1_MG-2023]|uniref:TonB-dependent receptor n=1 Tax=Psychrosphaera sp. 1_MG-2023 TaxID=3062643 RepID=UPI0026E1CF45|nr:TonB-dependent receptor [Psychrosphaera sp. 1_MG-2023]MDO6719729.1 TonB-dependent receptor [Psychrosphaera sp. 1_MG-2023]